MRWDKHPGVLQQIDLPHLVRDVEAADSLVVLRVAVGEVVSDGTVVATVHDGVMDTDAVLASLTVGPERTFDQDPLLAMRVLVDIGLKALSPAINDPTTAVQVIDWTLADEVPPPRRGEVEERLRWVRRELKGRRPIVPAESTPPPG